MPAPAEGPIRDALERHGLWAKKSLGQHFLLDLNLTRRIARSAGDLAGQAVIEVGPGPGGLTRALLEAGADPLIAIEKDQRFMPLLDELVPGSDGRLRLVNADALTIDEPALLDGARAHIVSNLPYNVATPLLIKWLKAGAWRASMTLMVQKEVAQRIVAQPRTPAYGRLAVIAQARCQVRYGFTVPARAFSPPPKVESAIVHFAPRDDAYPHPDDLERVTAAAFGQRRKMLRQALAGLAADAGLDAEALLARAAVAPTARAEEIAPAGFLALADAVHKLGRNA
ncbi:MAG: 16S rRNA (adenine(1518)-N(6)/adenine(1519)-N(6))-dimethyltransferase RsmA [Hydrogenophilaceae bacterium]|nr:16S rRNA (adenine(1518)-N(6)/adenine(1519)-N(6))-dimethyltransferase RsmA [Hydrogenophilaceae bacterium]